MPKGMSLLEEYKITRYRLDLAVTALAPFAAYGNLSGLERLDPAHPITQGSRMAARQLTVEDVRNAATTVAIING